MTKLLIDSDTLTDIADAIRDKEESSNPIQVSNMAYRIEHIQTGGIPVTSVTIDNKSAFQNLSFEGTYLTIPIEVTVSPETAPQWSQIEVSDPNMVHILDDGDGTHSLHILKGGTCTVTVYDYSGSVSDSMTITINQALVDIAFTASSLNLTTGVSRKLNVQFKPATATNQTLVWSSSHSDITVDQNGIVTANGAGHATITAYSAAISKTITCTIDVAANPDTTDWADVKTNWQNYGAGTLLPSTLLYNGSSQTLNWRVVDADYPVTLPDGTTARATIILAEESMPFTCKISTEQKIACDSATEPTALADTYYYGYNGSTYTKLNVVAGDTLPYADYTTIYKSGLNYTKNFSVINNNTINRWDGAELRAMLNSDADNVSTNYTPVHITDVCTGYTGKGFLQMIPSDMLAVVGTIKNTTVNNNSCFDGDTYTTDDLFWVPAAYQMNFLPSSYDSRPVASNALEGTPFQYYVNEIGDPTNNAADCRRKHATNRSDYQPYWLRSAYYGSAGSQLQGDGSGSLDQATTGAGVRFAPACAILH